MKKFRNVPALITLLAGFVTSVLMIINRIPIVTFLWTLALVMVGFFFVGLLVRFILNKFFQEKDDENKYNNCASNLEWMSHKDNVNYGNCINKRRKVMADKKGIKIYQYTKECEFIKEYCSIHEASRQTGITYDCIRQTADKYGKRGNLLTAGGFIWSKYRK